MPTVAVGERVDQNKAVMEPDGDLIRWICPVFHPVPCILHKQPQLRPYLMEVHADISVGIADGAGPSPDLAKHPLVKRQQKALFQHIAATGKSSGSRISDVFLLGLVELGPRGDVRQEKLPSFVGIEKRLVGMLWGEQRIAHKSSQSRLPSFTSAFANRVTSAARARELIPWPSSCIECDVAAT